MIYMMQAGVRGPIKIGHVKGGRSDVEARRATLQCGCPQELTVIAVAPGDVAIEALLHDYFAALRIGGEWFVFPQDCVEEWTDLDLIVTISNAMLDTIGMRIDGLMNVEPTSEAA
jgi:hypothetical protein